MGRGVLLGQGKDRPGTGYVQTGQRKKPRLALVGRNRRMVKRGVTLTDGGDKFLVKDEQRRVDGMWYQLENVFTSVGAWFRLEDLDDLAIILDQQLPEE